MRIASFTSFGPSLISPTSRMPTSLFHIGQPRTSLRNSYRRLGFGDRRPASAAASPLPSALAPLGLAHLDGRVLVDEFLGYERYPHAPSGVDAEQPAELSERQLLVVDTDDDFPIRPAVVDDAAEHVAARDPLIAVLVIVDLLLPRRFFGDHFAHASRSAH